MCFAVWGVLAAATCVQAGLIPRVDSATARQGAAQVSVESLELSARGEAGYAELEEAVSLYREGDIDATLTRLGAAWEANSLLPPPPVMLARMHFATGAIIPGRQLLEQAAIDHPDAADVYLALADLALAEGRWTDAALQYEQASSLMRDLPAAEAPRAVDAISGLAAVAERRALWDEAERLLTSCLELSPENASFKQRLGRTEFEQGRHDDAAKSLREAEQLDAQLEPAALAMARWHHLAGDADEAEAWMQTALEQNPDDPRTRISATLWNLEIDRPEEAHRHIEHLAKVHPDATDLIHLQGIVAIHRNDFETAERCFQRLVTENPGNFASSNQLALVLIEREGDSPQRRALQLAELNMRQYPTSADARATLGWVLYRHGRLDDAERIFQPLASGGNLSPDAAFYIARLLIDRGRPDAARTLLVGAVKAPGIFRNRKPSQTLLESLPALSPKESTEQK